MISHTLDPRPIEMILIDEIEDRLTNGNRFSYTPEGYESACFDIRELIVKYRKAVGKRRARAIEEFFSDQP